ncbi:MAG: hypothetical protein QOG94_478 [Solirubrobacteraceae bacterium]|nr:hypothetical protein [Solirubrobacteraceae bacterium]
MTLVLDAGALIAVERADRNMLALLAREHRAGRTPVTHGGVVGQVWSGASRDARVGGLLAGVVVVALDETLGRAAGVLLARAGASDVIDAAVVLLATDGDEILTSDPHDLAVLTAASGVHADIVAV